MYMCVSMTRYVYLCGMWGLELPVNCWRMTLYFLNTVLQQKLHCCSQARAPWPLPIFYLQLWITGAAKNPSLYDLCITYDYVYMCGTWRLELLAHWWCMTPCFFYMFSRQKQRGGSAVQWSTKGRWSSAKVETFSPSALPSVAEGLCSRRLKV